MKNILVLGIFAATILSSLSAFAQSFGGSNGGVDPHAGSYNMHLAPDGEPSFSPSLSGNDPLVVKDYWDSLFYRSTAYDSLIDKGLVKAFASDADNLYVGGSFEYFDGIRCYHIMRYNKTSGIWSVMDSGMSATVEVIKIHNGKIYAGGRFSNVGFNSSTRLNQFAVWDEVSGHWQQVGGGVNNTVHDIQFMDTSIIVGGDFTSAGGTPVSYVARWDGHTWDNMYGGVPGNVYTMLLTGDSLYVGGSFYTRTGPVSEIGLYHQGDWLNLGDGLDGNVYALAQYKGQLWVGGDFTTTAHDQQELYSLAIWDGNNWNAFGSGADTGTPGQVYSILPVGDSIYIGGNFNSVAGVTAHGLIKWSKGIFSPVGSGVYGEVDGLYSYNGSLYVGGTFLTAGNLSVKNLAKVNSGDKWGQAEVNSGAVGGYSETYINAVLSTPKYVFIGGSFSTIARKPFNNIAAWDKVNRKWIALGKGVDNIVYSLAIQGSNLYVGGIFTIANDSSAKHIAYWDMNANTWHPMGAGSVRSLSAIGANETGVYAAVFFPFNTSGLYDYLGRWDGSQWNLIDAKINGYVNAVTAQGSLVTVGGNFTSVNGTKASHIAQYDGSNWYPLGTGLSHRVRSIVMTSTDIYAAGDFVNAGAYPVNYVARWDGSTWNDLKIGLNNTVNALAWDGTSLYVAGDFTQTMSFVTVNRLAKWDGSNWSALSGGTEYNIYGLAVDNAAVYIGGGFSQVNGGKLNSFRFGILHFGAAGVDELSSEKSTVKNYPNPFSSETKITYSVAHDGPVTIEIYNLLGVKCKTVVNEFNAAGDYEVTADMRDIPNGTYLCKYTEGGITQTKEITLVK
jgi:hypothetical protein